MEKNAVAAIAASGAADRQRRRRAHPSEELN
jgi:hypothetical protein